MDRLRSDRPGHSAVGGPEGDEGSDPRATVQLVKAAEDETRCSPPLWPSPPSPGPDGGSWWRSSGRTSTSSRPGPDRPIADGVPGEQHTGPTKTHQAWDIALDPSASRCSPAVGLHGGSVERAESPLVPDPYVLSYNANGATPANPDTLTHGFGSSARRWRRRRSSNCARRSRGQADRPGAGGAVAVPVPRSSPLLGDHADRRRRRIRTVADRHGHARATMTLDLYAHALPGAGPGRRRVAGESPDDLEVVAEGEVSPSSSSGLDECSDRSLVGDDPLPRVAAVALRMADEPSLPPSTSSSPSMNSILSAGREPFLVERRNQMVPKSGNGMAVPNVRPQDPHLTLSSRPERGTARPTVRAMLSEGRAP